MPEPRPHEDPALAAVLTQLALDDLPEPLFHAVVEALDWVGRLDREAASRAQQGVTRPR